MDDDAAPHSGQSTLPPNAKDSQDSPSLLYYPPQQGAHDFVYGVKHVCMQILQHLYKTLCEILNRNIGYVETKGDSFGTFFWKRDSSGISGNTMNSSITSFSREYMSQLCRDRRQISELCQGEVVCIVEMHVSADFPFETKKLARTKNRVGHLKLKYVLRVSPQ